jgi:inner membrane protein
VPSAIAHAAPALALIPLFRRPESPTRLWVLGVACAMAPDLDVAAFRFGIPYEHWLGHRGLWHGIPFAALLAAAVCLLEFPRPRPGFSRPEAWLYLFLATASHGLLDTFTNGGLGIALWCPFDCSRHFAPFRPIEVSPLGVRAFLSARGLEVLWSELCWVWLPCALLWLGCRGVARRAASSATSP